MCHMPQQFPAIRATYIGSVLKLIRQLKSSKENPRVLQLLQLKKGEKLHWGCHKHGMESLPGQAAWVYRGKPELSALKANSNYRNKF